MKASIFDVAKKSGLSVVTVSRVINNSGTVREKNRDRVLQAMKELDYHPNASARSLARGKTGVIGLTITTLQDSFLDAVVKDINDRLSAKGYYLALSISNGENGSMHRSLFQEDRVDGLILLSPVHEDAYVEELKQKKIPFVMLDNQKTHPDVSSVVVDNFKGGYDATKHLIELGHSDIAHIRGPALFLSSKERERGYLTAMAEAGLRPYAIEQGDFSIPSGYRIASEWLRSGRLPSAVFAADDLMALGAMDALKNEGIKIPQQISIVGFDDHIHASEFRPKLTTVRQPVEQIGAHGVDVLLAMIDGTAVQHERLQFSPELIVRESTGRPASKMGNEQSG